MELKEIDLLELLKIAWANRKKVVKFSVIGFFIGAVIAFSIPKEYSTYIKLAPEGSSGRDLGSMGSLAGMMGINIGGAGEGGIKEDIYPEIIRSNPFLLELSYIKVNDSGKEVMLHEYILDDLKKPWWNSVLAAPGKIMSLFKKDEDKTFENSLALQNKYIEEIKERLSVAQDKKSKIFTISTTMQSPEVCVTVADSVISKLQKYMTHYRTSKSRNNLETSENMYLTAKKKFYEADSVYAKAADQNQNIRNLSAKIKLDRLESERNLAFSVYQQLATQVEVDRVKLQEDTPVATVIEPSRIPIKPSAPKKASTALMFAILAGCLAGAITIFKNLKF